jgi:hypothetical protein
LVWIRVSLSNFTCLFAFISFLGTILCNKNSLLLCNIFVLSLAFCFFLLLDDLATFLVRTVNFFQQYDLQLSKVLWVLCWVFPPRAM